MDVKITKSVEVWATTKRGQKVRVYGGNGMFTLAIGKSCDKNVEHWLYTDELDAIILTLQKFKETLQSKQEI